MLGAGVIGLGVGRIHCEGYTESEDVELKAVCDISEERLKKAEKDFGVQGYKDVDSFLEREDIDIVSVCTPDYTHTEIALKVIESGKHLLLEKPMALTIEDCYKIENAIKNRGVVFSIDYEFRLNPVISKLKEIIDSGAIGRMAGVSFYYWRGPFEWTKPQRWIQKEKYSGGMIVEETCHWFDLIRWFGGEVKDIHCLTNGWVYSISDFEDIAYINCRYKSGAIAQLSHVLTGFDYLFNLWVFGTKGSAWAVQKDDKHSYLGVGENEFYGLVSTKLHTSKEINVKKFCTDECREYKNIKEHAKYFAHCVATGKEPLVSAEDGRKSVELALAARKSAKENKIVTITS